MGYQGPQFYDDKAVFDAKLPSMALPWARTD